MRKEAAVTPRKFKELRTDFAPDVAELFAEAFDQARRALDEEALIKAYESGNEQRVLEMIEGVIDQSDRSLRASSLEEVLAMIATETMTRSFAAAYSPSQERDDHGRWTDGGNAAQTRADSLAGKGKNVARDEISLSQVFGEPAEFKPQPIEGTGRTEDVKLEELIPTQSNASLGTVKSFIKDPKLIRPRADNKHLPLVYRTPDGKQYIIDGHNRLTADKLSGESTSPARVFDAEFARAARFDPNQERDQYGRWVDEGGGAPSGKPLARAKERAWSGEPVALRNQPTKQETGDIGERVALQYLEHQVGESAIRLSRVKANNFPIDVVVGNNVVEVKAGLASNGRTAQQWRLTIGQPGKAESAWLARASDKAKAAWNERKQKAIVERKIKAMRAVSKETGRKLTPKTVTLILNPDKGVADIYEFKGWHQNIRWNSSQAHAAYKGSFKYGR